MAKAKKIPSFDEVLSSLGNERFDVAPAGAGANHGSGAYRVSKYGCAAEIAQSRVNAGVHYPSDIHEGEVLGKATGAAILASSAFQADLADVQAELKK